MTTPNLSKIKEDFDKVIQYSQQIPDPKTDRLFDIWWECKKDFIDQICRTSRKHIWLFSIG